MRHTLLQSRILCGSIESSILGLDGFFEGEQGLLTM